MRKTLIVIFVLFLFGCSPEENQSATLTTTEVKTPIVKEKYKIETIGVDDIVKLPSDWTIIGRNKNFIYAFGYNDLQYYLYRYDITDGSIVEKIINIEIVHETRISTEVLVINGLGYVSGFSLDPDITEKVWEATFPETGGFRQIISDIEDNKYVYATTNEYTVKLDITTGEQIWFTEVFNYFPLKYDINEKELIQTGEDFVITFDKLTGEVIKKQQTQEANRTHPLKVCSMCNLIGYGPDGKLYVYNSGMVGIIADGKFNVIEDLTIPSYESRFVSPRYSIIGDNLLLYEGNRIWVNILTNEELWTIYEIPYDNLEIVNQYKNYLYLKNEQSIYEINLEKFSLQLEDINME